MPTDRSAVNIVTGSVNRVPVLMLEGVLDISTYQQLRDAIIKVALDEPRAVIIDVSKLSVPADSAWTLFTEIRRQVSESPNVPIMLVCEHLHGRETIRRNCITRYVPVYRNVDSALDELPSPSDLFHRRRAQAQLPSLPVSVTRAQELATQWLTEWDKPEFISVASVVAPALVEYVLERGDELSLRVECNTTIAMVAVEAPGRAEDSASDLTGLAPVAVMSRSWGRTNSASGTTVWAVIVPEDEL